MGSNQTKRSRDYEWYTLFPDSSLNIIGKIYWKKVIRWFAKISLALEDLGLDYMKVC